MRRIFSAMLLALAANAAGAQSYPSKPVRLVVPYPAGGVVDVLGRIIAEKISANWGQQVLVDPKPGGNSMIGTEIVLNAAADGYTWLLATPSHAANPAIHGNLRWDPARDFSAAGLFAYSPNYFVVPVSLPVSNVREYVALAKSKPGQLNYGNPGTGSSPHLGFELFKRVTGIDVVAVGYRGVPPLIPDLFSGQLSATFMPAVLTIGQVKTGKIKILAAIANSRGKAFPEVPTLAEAGFPEAQVVPWFGIVVPSKTPREIVQRISAEIGKAVAAQEVIERIEKAGAMPAAAAADEFDALIRKEVATWARVVKEAGIKPE